MGRKFCIVDSCDTTDTTTGVSLHRFPKEDGHRNAWMDYVRKVNGKVSKQDGYICAKHFKSCCISTSTPSRPRLNPGHGPTLDSEKCHANLTEDSEVDSLRAEVDKLKRKLGQLKQKYEAALNEIRVLRQFKTRHELKRKSRLADGLPNKKIRSESSTTNPGSSESAEILKHLASRQMTGCAGYSEQIKEFAFKLHYYSPRAYWFVRDYFGKSLPHPRSFGRWTQHIVTTPGFLEVALKFIEHRSLNHTHIPYYSLIIDEVSIRKQIIHDGDKMKGFIDYGGIIAQIPTDIEAKSALFVLASEINGHKKTPIVYILTNGLSSSSVAEVVTKSLIKMWEMSAKVLSVTFDGLKSNFTAMEMLGAKLNTSAEIVPFIRHPSTGSKVFVFPDPSHMFKLMRNSLKRFGKFYTESDEMVEWKYLRQLLDLQTESGLRAANKLTSRHVNFEQQKMKTKLCTQMFSSSVSVALRVCRKLNISDFAGSGPTSSFIALMDRLFDSLNSKPRGKGFKAPLRSSNRHHWQELFNQCIENLLHLKYIPTPPKSKIKGSRNSGTKTVKILSRLKFV